MSAVINNIDTDILCLLILVFIYSNTIKRAEKAFTQHRLFVMLIGALSVLLLIDTVSWIVNGMPGAAAHTLNWVFNLLLFLGVPLVPCFWMLYADFQVFHEEGRLRRYRLPIWAYLSVNGLISVFSLFNGWFFQVDAGNMYHRGPLYLLNPLLCILMMLYTLCFIAANRSRIDRRHYLSLLLFALPPFLGGLLQSVFYGLALAQCGLTLSALMLHFSIQDRRLDTDYLTGVFNRGVLDRYLREKLEKASPFSAILADLDGFKAINDTHGHVAGDNALLDAVAVLRSCLRENDFIARYGGDEFFVSLDITQEEVLAAKVEKIRNALDEFNKSGDKPYRISFSIGYTVYKGEPGMDIKRFLQRLDSLLYQDKDRAGGWAQEAKGADGAVSC